ncbi:MAG: hypothetical protein PHG06_17635 [Parabacteroides sp.]|nr:hypothetical protein [Parabacteroides sp.]
MKSSHTKYFIIFYIIALAMMGTPLVSIANKPLLIFGIPMLLAWLLGWCLALSIALILNYKMDTADKGKNSSI